jgi:hypothetical protein
MKYLCLIYEEEPSGRRFEDEDDTCCSEDGDEDSAIRDSDRLWLTLPFRLAWTAMSVRVRLGRVSTGDGTCAGNGERLGQLTLIEARDLNAAIRVAAQMPMARRGCIEVRPVEACEPR